MKDRTPPESGTPPLVPDTPMTFENPPVPEGINVSERHPLRAFFTQGGLAVGIFACCLAVLSAVAGLLAPHVPFSWERKAAAGLFSDEPPTPEEQALRRLAERVAGALDMPADMPIVIHYDPDDTVNAGATLGGHIVVFRGILRHLESEDELAALLAHEIAHVKHRDVVRGLSRGLAAMLLLSGVDSVGPVFSGVGQAATLSFSRAQERRADVESANATAALYGHTAGALTLFARLRDKVSAGPLDELGALELTRSHPNFGHRIETVRLRSRELGRPESGRLTPLPEVLRKAREGKRGEKP